MNPFDIGPLSSNDPTQPRVRWGSNGAGWKLVQLFDLSEPLFPPGRDLVLTRDDLNGAGYRVPLVVLGEAGSGTTSIVQWAMDTVGRPRSDNPPDSSNSAAGAQTGRVARAGGRSARSKPARATRSPGSPSAAATPEPSGAAWVVHVDLSTLPHRNRLAQQEQALPELLANKLGGTTTAPTGLSLLDNLNLKRPAETGRPVTVIVTHLVGLHEQVAVNFFSQLRGLAEEGALAGTQIVLFGQDLPQFQTDLYSDLLPLCRTYRTPHFSLADIRTLWHDLAARADSQPEWSPGVPAACLDWTGGQPLLTRLFLKAVGADHWSPEEAGARLRDNPPAQVRRWQAQLSLAMQRDPHLRRAMRAYAEGETFGERPPPGTQGIGGDHLPLFVGGWIGRKPASGPAARSGNGAVQVEEEGPAEWAIRSRCHAAWARPVISAAGRGVVIDAGDGEEGR